MHCSTINSQLLPSGTSLLALLTLQPEVLFAIQIAQAVDSPSLVIFVQDVSHNNTFSPFTDIPPSLQDLLSQQPIRLISKVSTYFERSIDEIVSLYEKELDDVASNKLLESSVQKSCTPINDASLQVRVYFRWANPYFVHVSSFKRTSGLSLATSLSNALAQSGYSSFMDSNFEVLTESMKSNK